jgi:hypothetical protein
MNYNMGKSQDLRKSLEEVVNPKFAYASNASQFL